MNGNVCCGECGHFHEGSCLAAELALYRAGFPDAPRPVDPLAWAETCTHYHPAPNLIARLKEHNPRPTTS